MTVREKILIWLDKCYGICNEKTECDECPFFTLNDGGCTSRLREVLTRELLKEQEPKKQENSGDNCWPMCGDIAEGG